MDGGQNESLSIGAAIGGLAFGKPPRRAALVHALTRDQAPGEPLIVGRDYATITLAHQQLSKPRIITSRFRPIFYADAAFAQDFHAPIRFTQLIPSLPDAITKSGKVAGQGLTAMGDRLIFSQTPYRGGMTVQFNLLASRSEAMLKSLAAFAKGIRGATRGGQYDDGGYDTAPYDGGYGDEGGYGVEYDEMGNENLLGDLASAAGEVVSAAADFVVPHRAAAKVGLAAANALIAHDGEWTPRLEYARSMGELKSGHYVLYQLKSDSEPIPNLEYDADRQIVYADGKPVKRRDLAVLRVDVTHRRSDITSIPGLGEAFRTLDTVFVSNGDIGPAMDRFIRVATTTPHLADQDREDLIDRVRTRMSGLLSGAEMVGENPNEGLLDMARKSVGLGNLKAVWDAAEVAYDRVRRAYDEAAATLPEHVPEPEIPETVGPQDPDFDAALAFSLRWEGGFSDHPNDTGGRTNKGITERVYHEWLDSHGEPPKAVEHITDAEVDAIYYANYWLAARCNRMPDPVFKVQFDAAVNHGPGGAAKMLQRALGDIGVPGIAVDGRIGPQTLEAVGKANPGLLAEKCLARRESFYHWIVERNESQRVFLNGWLNRLRDLARSIGLAANESVGDEIVRENTPLALYPEHEEVEV